MSDQRAEDIDAALRLYMEQEASCMELDRARREQKGGGGAAAGPPSAASRRRTVVAWIFNLCEWEELLPETAHKAIHLMDRTLSVADDADADGADSRADALAAASLCLACKLIEVIPMSPTRIIGARGMGGMGGGEGALEAVLAQEKRVLRDLEFRTDAPSAFEFWSCFQEGVLCGRRGTRANCNTPCWRRTASSST